MYASNLSRQTTTPDAWVTIRQLPQGASLRRVGGRPKPPRLPPVRRGRDESYGREARRCRRPRIIAWCSGEPTFTWHFRGRVLRKRVTLICARRVGEHAGVRRLGGPMRRCPPRRAKYIGRLRGRSSPLLASGGHSLGLSCEACRPGPPGALLGAMADQRGMVSGCSTWRPTHVRRSPTKLPFPVPTRTIRWVCRILPGHGPP